jgi:uncharacterized membrane protein YqhA
MHIIRRILSASRYLILLAVLGSFIATVLLLGYGMLYELRVILSSPIAEISSKGLKTMVISLIEIIDLFLLGTGFYIIALGLYELFIDDQVPMPAWLQIHNFDDLKNKLVSILIVVLGVTFLSQALRWEGDQDLLGYGIAIGLVIAALAYFIGVKSKKDTGS